MEFRNGGIRSQRQVNEESMMSRSRILRYAAAAVALAAAGVVHCADTQTPAKQKEAAQIAADLGLEESARPLREMSPGWRKPTKLMVSVADNPGRIDIIRSVVPSGIELIPVKDKEDGLPRLGEVQGLIAGW